MSELTITRKEAFILLESRLQGNVPTNEAELKEYMSFAETLRNSMIEDEEIHTAEPKNE